MIDISSQGSSPKQRTYFIAELGLNHNGSLDLAKEMMHVAVDAGADAVKLQKRTIASLAIRSVLDSPDSRFPNLGKTYREVREKLEFTHDQYLELKALANDLGIDFIVTAFDIEAVDFLTEIGVNRLKIASHSVTNTPLIEYASKKFKSIIMSTGMSTQEEIDDAVAIIKRNGADLSLLHCVSSYPTQDSDLHLRNILFLSKRYGVNVGYSGHEEIELPTLIAVALGAQIIERHITLSRSLSGFDHKISLDPSELKRLILDIRRVELILGVEDKVLKDSELLARSKYNVSMVASEALLAGQKLLQSNITWKNPGLGIPPRRLNDFLGRTLRRDVDFDELLQEEDFE